MSLIIPQKYKQKLLPETTEIAIKTIKEGFQTELAAALNLRRVTAPLFVLAGTGLNKNQNVINFMQSKTNISNITNSIGILFKNI